MKYEADELLNLALMSKTPYIIVEGVDDIHVYESIAESVAVACEIYSVDMLEGLTGGSDGVIQALTDIQSISMPTGKTVENYITGVIDRDTRYFRGSMPALASLFVLDFYSIESHFVSKSAIKPCIDKVTRISSSDKVDIDRIFSVVEAGMGDLFYFSLDALRGAIDPGYDSVVGYSSNAGRRKDLNTATDLSKRKVDLDEFATTWRLTSEIRSMREFAKGKWLLMAYAEELFGAICQLTSKCKNKAIWQCRMCSIDTSAGCLFQTRDGMNKNSLYSILRDVVEIPDFDYIRKKFKLLAKTASI